jgi:23S rRNA pseudouridine1911/1915/1917 synthase
MPDKLLKIKEIDIIFEDTDLLVLNKPASLLVLPDRYDRGIPNLFDLLSKKYGKIFIVHRTDKETSGLVVFAKTSKAHAELNKQFRQRDVEKKYLSIVVGNVPQTEGEINLPLSERKQGVMQVDRRDGKTAITNYSVLEKFKGYTFIEAKPKTGRTHQIRIHLQAIGIPILSDPVYGNGRGFFLSDIKPHYKGKEEEVPLLSRTALHAASISFSHSLSNERLNLAAELPKDMNTVLKYLRKFRS